MRRFWYRLTKASEVSVMANVVIVMSKAKRVELSIMGLLSLTKTPEPPDVADALAIAITAGIREH
ncbi:MAG TPA: hypothetical protein EYO31_05325 [Phycisphaerales bacterium]|nr:hypothetical protein [Phycisphaerales bacterium]